MKCYFLTGHFCVCIHCALLYRILRHTYTCNRVELLRYKVLFTFSRTPSVKIHLVGRSCSHESVRMVLVHEHTPTHTLCINTWTQPKHTVGRSWVTGCTPTFVSSSTLITQAPKRPQGKAKPSHAHLRQLAVNLVKQFSQTVQFSLIGTSCLFIYLFAYFHSLWSKSLLPSLGKTKSY